MEALSLQRGRPFLALFLEHQEGLLVEEEVLVEVQPEGLCLLLCPFFHLCAQVLREVLREVLRQVREVLLPSPLRVLCPCPYRDPYRPYQVQQEELREVLLEVQLQAPEAEAQLVPVAVRG